VLDELRTAHLRHDHIGDDQMDLPVESPGDSQRVLPVTGLKDVVPAIGQEPAGNRPYPFVVLDKQDGCRRGRG
jgi:hypothetical protein